VTWLDDLEQRLVRAGARGLSQQFADQVGRALGRPDDTAKGDVWDVATHEDERAGEHPPECAWCPLCRAIRLSRESGPGFAGHVSGAADALATAAQDALNVLDEILSRSAARRDGEPPFDAPPREHPQEDRPGNGQPGNEAPRNGQAPGGQAAAGQPPASDEAERPGDGPESRP
jgi:hypothetical protein